MSETTNKFSPGVRERAVRSLLDQEQEYLVAEPRSASEQQQLTPMATAETVQGTGLGTVLSETEGRARLKAAATTVAVEAWAGQLARPTAL
jgi:hypothetical protein